MKTSLKKNVNASLASSELEPTGHSPFFPIDSICCALMVSVIYYFLHKKKLSYSIIKTIKIFSSRL